MQCGSLTTLFGLGIIAFVLAYFVRCLRHPLNQVPGPFYARFTRLPLKAAIIGGRRIHHVHTLHNRYGPLVRISPGEVAVADPVAYKQIHGVGSAFSKSPWYKDMTASDRDGVFTMADSKPHAARRRLLSRPFSKTHLRQNWESVVREKGELAVARIRGAAMDGDVDILKWFTFMASDISTKIMFGEDFQTLERGEVSDYIRTLQSALMGGGIGVELPAVRWIGRRLPITYCRDLWATQDTLFKYGNLAIANMRGGQGHTNIFANMMAEAEKGETLDNDDVRIEAQNLIVAGTDTTSITLTYLVWAVLSRPQLQQRVEAEVATLQDDFRDSDVEQLDLLNAVIQETLRLYGAAPGGLPRIVPKGGALFSGIFIPEGTTVTTQAFTSHRDAQVFPDPYQFVPERWMASGEGSQYRVTEEARAAYSPFGSGARSCLGLHLALIELRLTAARFFKSCPGARLAPSVTPESMELENFFLVAPAAHRCEISMSL